MRELDIQASKAAAHIGMAVLILRQLATPRAYEIADQLQPLVAFAERAADDGRTNQVQRGNGIGWFGVWKSGRCCRAAKRLDRN